MNSPAECPADAVVVHPIATNVARQFVQETYGLGTKIGSVLQQQGNLVEIAVHGSTQEIDDVGPVGSVTVNVQGPNGPEVVESTDAATLLANHRQAARTLFQSLVRQ